MSQSNLEIPIKVIASFAHQAQRNMAYNVVALQVPRWLRSYLIVVPGEQHNLPYEYER